MQHLKQADSVAKANSAGFGFESFADSITKVLMHSRFASRMQMNSPLSRGSRSPKRSPASPSSPHRQSSGSKYAIGSEESPAASAAALVKEHSTDSDALPQARSITSVRQSSTAVETTGPKIEARVESRGGCGYRLRRNSKRWFNKLRCAVAARCGVCIRASAHCCVAEYRRGSRWLAAHVAFEWLSLALVLFAVAVLSVDTSSIARRNQSTLNTVQACLVVWFGVEV